MFVPTFGIASVFLDSLVLASLFRRIAASLFALVWVIFSHCSYVHIGPKLHRGEEGSAEAWKISQVYHVQIRRASLRISWMKNVESQSEEHRHL